MEDEMQVVVDLSKDPDDPDRVTYVPLTPEQQADREAIAAEAGREAAVERFATDEDAERLAVIRERAETDPAYAALADLVLGTKGVQT